jgi:hypothetical protein
MNERSVTIDAALELLQKAKERIGGDKCLILCLVDSGIQDANVELLEIVDGTEEGEESQYIRVSVDHGPLDEGNVFDHDFDSYEDDEATKRIHALEEAASDLLRHVCGADGYDEDAAYKGLEKVVQPSWQKEFVELLDALDAAALG